MQIETKIKQGAKVTLTIGLEPGGIRHIKMIAPTIEAREEAMVRVKRILPGLELIEDLLTPPETHAEGSAQAEGVTDVPTTS